MRGTKNSLTETKERGEERRRKKRGTNLPLKGAHFLWAQWERIRNNERSGTRRGRREVRLLCQSNRGCHSHDGIRFFQLTGGRPIA